MSPDLRANRVALALVYGAAFLQGLMLVSYPASAAFFKTARGLTDERYGLVFLPQLVCAIAGATAGSAFACRLGLRGLLSLSLLGTAASQVALAAAGAAAPAFVFPLAATSGALTGLSFGLGAAPLNALPALLLPARAAAALLALHTLIGLGLAAGPLLVGPLLAAGRWIIFPATLALAGIALGLAARSRRLPASDAATGVHRGGGAADAGPPWAAPAFWAFVAVVVLYSFAEGVFANWSAIYLREERGVSAMTANLALSAFWAALAGGRLLGTALLLRLSARQLWRALPLLMIAACWLIPGATGGVSGVALFALAGLGCSAFFPLTIGLATERFAAHAASVSALLVAALMLGNGLGSYALGALREGRSLAVLYAAAAVFPAAALLVGWPLTRRSAPAKS